MRRIILGVSLFALALAPCSVRAAETVESLQTVFGAAHDALKQGDYAKTIILMTQTLASSQLDLRANLSAHLLRGMAYLSFGQQARSVDDLSDVISQIPAGDAKISDPMMLAAATSAYGFRGLAYQQLGKYDLSIADFQKTVQYEPDVAENYVNLGNSYYGSGKRDDAIASYSEAIARDPDNTEAFANRGENYENEKKYGLAIADYTRAIALKPDYAMAYDDRGTALGAEGKYSEALPDSDKAVSLEPSWSHFNNRAYLYTKLSRWQAAIDDYNRALALADDPKVQDDIRKDLAQAQASLGASANAPAQPQGSPVP